MAQYSFESLAPEYSRLWGQMYVTNGVGAQAEARKIIAGKDNYKAAEKLTGVPWFVIGCLNVRESGGNFTSWLHNGDPMRRGGVPVRTVHVPAGRPPDPNVSWAEGAYDALVTCEHLGGITDWGPERVAYISELYNGFGYRSPARNIPSPYLWGGTSVQKRGKFVADGVYNANVMDTQIGTMAILKAVMQMDPEAVFPVSPPPIEKEPEPIEPRAQPRADDTETNIKPLSQSTTIKGGLILGATQLLTVTKGFFENLHDPYTLAAFGLVLLVGAAGLYLVISGRINAQKVIAHLSVDDN